MSSFSKEEQIKLLADLNQRLPEKIKFEHDGYFPYVICLKAKNYILQEESGQIKKKGSSLKSSTLEPVLKLFLDDIINLLLKDATHEQLTQKYNEYVKMINNIKDIKPWCSKKTITEKTYESERANETKILAALENSEYVEGDKIYTFFKSNDDICLAENFDGDYSKIRLYEKLYKCTQRFSTILPIKELFLNYSLKRNNKNLMAVVNE